MSIQQQTPGNSINTVHITQTGLIIGMVDYLAYPTVLQMQVELGLKMKIYKCTFRVKGNFAINVHLLPFIISI